MVSRFTPGLPRALIALLLTGPSLSLSFFLSHWPLTRSRAVWLCCSPFTFLWMEPESQQTVFNAVCVGERGREAVTAQYEITSLLVIVCVCVSFIFFCPLSSFPFIPPFPVPVFVSFLFFCVFPLFRLLYFNRWLWCSKTEKGYTWAVVSFFRSFLVESSISCLDPPQKTKNKRPGVSTRTLTCASV